MILHVLDDRGRPTVIAASRVVIFLGDGATPVAAAVDAPGGAVGVEQAADAAGRPNPAFPAMLRAQGLDRSYVLERAPLRRLEDFRFRGESAT